jgi:hypothetical protein
MSTEEKVILLALLKKEESEGIRDILAILENSRVFTMKEGKRLVKGLKNDGYISGSDLTPKGYIVAKQVEMEFKI